MSVKEKLIRVSIGTLALLKDSNLKINVKPRTAYLLQYSRNGCRAKCIFCRQSMSYNGSREYLSRIPWPTISIQEFIERYRSTLFKRICIQTILKKDFIDEVIEIIEFLREYGVETPISICTTPTCVEKASYLKKFGVDYIGIGLDASSPRIFKLVRKPFTWNTYIDFIKSMVGVYGYRRVIVHLIVGIGETNKELYNTMKYLIDLGCNIALFAYTPPYNEPSNRPSIYRYRRAQLVRCLLLEGYSLESIIYYTKDKAVLKKHLVRRVLDNIDRYLDCLLTSGCPECNRPYYNESPRGPLYNIPSREILTKYRSVFLKEIYCSLRVF